MITVFTNYRTGDTDKAAALVDGALRREFGEDRAFRDHRSMSPGVDFPPVIKQNLRKSDVLLVLIGSEWLTLKDSATGRPRIEAEEDWVRTEIEWALDWGLIVIPVTVDGARLPTADELPEEIRELARRQRAFLRTSHEHIDIPVLIDAIREGTARAADPKHQDDAPAADRITNKIKSVKRTAFTIGGGNAHYHEGSDRKERK
ncbi:toll/interleukin-1 receptor domain-containing protein [Streptomyces spongiae]|nr:toll/interleukin-1 receptor domain-containing protein [Streptomyces spongiae]